MGSELDHRSRVAQASRGALAPGLFVRHVRRPNEPRKRGVSHVKQPAVRIRRIKSPGLTHPGSPRLFFFVYFVVLTFGFFARCKDFIRPIY